mmetsp:Transcript_7168/g.18567  ORF Transcript_7168/g.18567 Transcript_7168/m.18567 type:complete len:719 (-) Transcript_7168:325-2481(-)
MGTCASKPDPTEFTGIQHKYSAGSIATGYSRQSEAETATEKQCNGTKTSKKCVCLAPTSEQLLEIEQYFEKDISHWSSTLSVEKKSLLLSVALSTVGAYAVFDTPFGSRRLVYADYTASGRALGLVEDYIKNNVLPFYANTHTESSVTGYRTGFLREEARRLVKEAVNAGEDYALIFCGPGSTAAIAKFIDMMGLRFPSELVESRGAEVVLPPPAKRPVIFVGPYEHHSNEVSWRETIADVVVIEMDSNGDVDVEDLRSKLEIYKDRPLKIGSFSAGSNVTGIVTETDEITSLLHEYGCISAWDYAGAAPYVSINTEHKGDPRDPALDKDVIFISPHKLIGGPGTPGVLVCRRSLLKNAVPAVPGGGTVTFVTPEEQFYEASPEVREEGGTPAIVESIRCGLVFRLKSLIGSSTIEGIEENIAQKVLSEWQSEPNIIVVGGDFKAVQRLHRTTIISFNIKYDGATPLEGFDSILHPHYVSALLNDVYGIQSRSGCSCAGPYGHRLFGVDSSFSSRMAEAAKDGKNVVKLGWVRVNLNYFLPDFEVDFIINAVKMIARHGWRLLPLYAVNPHTGQWSYRGFDRREGWVCLSDFRPPSVNSLSSFMAHHLCIFDRVEEASESSHGTRSEPSAVCDAHSMAGPITPGTAHKVRFLDALQEDLSATALQAEKILTMSSEKILSSSMNLEKDEVPLGPLTEAVRWFPTSLEVRNRLESETVTQ